MVISPFPAAARFLPQSGFLVVGKKQGNKKTPKSTFQSNLRWFWCLYLLAKTSSFCIQFSRFIPVKSIINSNPLLNFNLLVCSILVLVAGNCGLELQCLRQTRRRKRNGSLRRLRRHLLRRMCRRRRIWRSRMWRRVRTSQKTNPARFIFKLIYWQCKTASRKRARPQGPRFFLTKNQ